MSIHRRAFALATLASLAVHVLTGCGDAGMFSKGELRAMEGGLYFVSIDSEVSTADVSAAIVDFERHYLGIDLAGLGYDSQTLLKIDLLLGPLNLLRGGGS